MTVDSPVLLSIEQRVRAQVKSRLDMISRHYGAFLSAAIREQQQLTGTELLSRADLDGVLTTVTAGVQAAVVSAVRAGYGASAKVAAASATRDLLGYGYVAPAKQPPDPGPHLALILGTVAAAFAAVRTDIHSSVRAAFDGVTGVSAVAAAARVLVVAQALTLVVRRLSVHTDTAATVAVHQGFTDAQQAIYGAFNAAHPSTPLYKRWQAGAADPCSFCRALDGTTLSIDTPFDPTASTKPHRRLKAFGVLSGPPRHPACRCRLVYVLTPASKKVHFALMAKITDDLPDRLAARDIRRMTSPRYTALTAFFRAAASRLARLLSRRRSHG